MFNFTLHVCTIFSHGEHWCASWCWCSPTRHNCQNCYSKSCDCYPNHKTTCGMCTLSRRVCVKYGLCQLPTLSIPIWSTFPFVNSHLVNFPLCQFPFAELPTSWVRHTKKMSEMEVSKSETCLWKIKYWGSSTVTNNKQKHSQNVMVNIFSSGCYAHYIHYNSCTTLLSQAFPVFNLLLFHSARPFYIIIHCGVSVCSCTWMLVLVNCIRNILHAWCVRLRL